MSQLILYDLPSKGRCSCWSPNPWKTRLALNYKGIDYKTEWVEYPDIASNGKSFGLEPNKIGTPYTIPMVRFPDGTHIMDSLPIAQRIEELYPEPSLHLDMPKFKEFAERAKEFATNTQPCWVYKVHQNILNPRSAEYFWRTREVRFGMPLDQLDREKATPGQWEKAKTHAKILGDMLRENDGPFLMDKTVSYADFILVGVLHCMKRVDEQAFETGINLDPAFKPLYDACRKWLERDDR